MTDLAVMYVEKGLVIDIDGKWVPMEKAISRERLLLEKLRAGYIPYKGKWALLEKACAAEKEMLAEISKSAPVPAPAPAKKKRPADPLLDHDTKLISLAEVQNLSASLPRDAFLDDNGVNDSNFSEMDMDESVDDVDICEGKSEPHKSDTEHIEIITKQTAEDLSKKME